MPRSARRGSECALPPTMSHVSSTWERVMGWGYGVRGDEGGFGNWDLEFGRWGGRFGGQGWGLREWG